MGDSGEYRKCGIRASIGEGKIRVSTGKGSRASIGEGKIRVSTEKGRIRASIEEGKIRVSTGKGRIQASTGNRGSGRVSEMWDQGEYRKCGIRASTEKVKSG